MSSPIDDAVRMAIENPKVIPIRFPEELPTLTDTGNSTRLIEMHGDRLRYVPPWGRWVVCGDDGFWIVDHKDVRVRELAKDVGRALKLEAAHDTDANSAKRTFAFAFQTLNARGVSGLVDLARGIDGVPLDHELLDADGWLLGVENGVIELRTGTLRPARPDDLMTMRCQVAYNPDAVAPRWEQAMKEWFPDQDVRAYVQRLAGSALVGAQRDHVFVIHFGLGSNGKGAFLRALQHVLGDYVVEIHLSLLIELKHREHDTVRADLFRKRLAVAVETARHVRLAEASVKNLTGGDRIRGRRMREDYWSFHPTHSLWLQTNHLPEIGGRDAGIWRRIRVVEWKSTFGSEAKSKETPGVLNEDPDLDVKLAAEAPGILAWLVRGCLSWQELGLKEPEAVIKATLAYRKKEDVLARFQQDVGLVFDPDLQIQAQELQDLLTDWAVEEGIKPPRQALGEWLRENGASKKQGARIKEDDGKERRPKFWHGVGIDDDAHQEEQINAAL